VYHDIKTEKLASK